jgi:anti-sigma factor RsiW
LSDDSSVTRPSPGADDLHAFSAFTDGELPARERKAMLARLLSDSDAAVRVAGYRAQKAALSIVCGNSCAPVQAIVVRPRCRWWRRSLEVFAYLMVGIALGLALIVTQRNSADELRRFAQRADTAYATYAPETRHAVEVSAIDEDRLVPWLSARVGRQLPAPSLQDYGYALIGGRLLPDARGPAAQFMYENSAGARVTLYVARVSSPTMGHGLYRSGNRGTSYWVEQATAYALTGNISDTQLQAMTGGIDGTLWDR